MQATAAGGVFQAVPSLLRSLDRWISWLPFESKRADGTPKTDKVPDYPWKNPRFWLGWAALEERISVSQSRPGFVFDGPVPVTGGWLFALDLDACRDPLTGEIAPWAVAVGLRCEWSYTEVTPSGTGLRVWVIVKEKPSRWGRQHFTPLGVDVPKRGKKPECQPFGASKLSFVAVTGQRLLESADEVKVIESFDWWPAIFGVTCDAGAVEASAVGTGSAALGEEPEVEEIRARVESEPHGKDLLGADWQGWLERPAGENGTAPPASGSEAYFRLVQLVLRACRGHAGAAVKFLLRETTWGRGGEGIGEKYQRAGWVESEVARVEAKTGAGARASGSVFEPLNDNPERPHSLSDGVVGAPGANAKPKERPKPWVRQTLKELLAEKPSPWVVQHYVRTKQVGVLAAFSTVGKSTLAAAWMMHVLYGKPWLDKRVRGGSVVALVGENRRGFANNLEAYARHHGWGEAPAGRYVELIDFKLPLSSPEGQAAVKALIAEVTKDHGEAPTLVVIDTLSSHWAESEDSSEFMAPAMRALAEVAQAHNCVILVVHHVTKGKGKMLRPEMADIRGSGVVGNNTDFSFAMWAPDEDGAVLEELKLKNDRGPGPVRLARVSVVCGSDEDGDEVTAAVFENKALAVTEAEQKQADALEADVEAIVGAMTALGTCSSKDAVVQRAGMKAQRGRACFAVALDRGLIEAVGRGRPSYRVTNKARTKCVFEAGEAGQSSLLG
jgi:hypothetical protein